MDKKIIRELNAIVRGWRGKANSHYCQTYNTGMAQGFNAAADHLEEYIKELKERQAPAPEPSLSKD